MRRLLSAERQPLWSGEVACLGEVEARVEAGVVGTRECHHHLALVLISAHHANTPASVGVGWDGAAAEVGH